MNEAQNHPVIVYTTSWCAFCHTEMQWLDRLGVAYEARDIEADEAIMSELKTKNGGSFQGVPVTDINGELILGFNRPLLESALRKYNLIPNL